MNSYKILNKQVFKIDNYSLVPIRFEDRLDIMKWRNEQIYHLRQNKPLNEEDQNNYFKTIVSNLFLDEKPNQILFSYLHGDQCIGYGGLVHINWIDKNAEISFIMNTELENRYFEFHWMKYLELLDQVAFSELNLHKIYTYAFDLRPRLYSALEKAGFVYEATLKEHCFFNGSYLDVLYHSKINNPKLRLAHFNDVNVTYEWAIDDEIRKFSFSKNKIELNEHIDWFSKKLENNECFYFILEDILKKPLGSIRLDLNNNEGIISYLVETKHFGKGYGTLLLQLIEQKVKEFNIPINKLVGYVMKENIASIKIFKKMMYCQEIENNNLKFFKEL